MTVSKLPEHPKSNGLRIWLHDHGGWLLALVVLLTLGLGMWGFQQYYTTLGQTVTWRDLLYAAIRLFNLESGQVDGVLPWALEVARWLAPLVLFYAVIYGVWLATRQQVGLLRARTYRHHLILCGLGEQGARLAEDLLDHPRSQPNGKPLRLVAIEPDRQLDVLTGLREKGLILLPGRATDEAMLRKAGVQRAHYLIVVTGRDEDNLDIAAKAFKLAGSARPPHPSTGKNKDNPKLICLVQLTNAGLRQVSYDHPLFAINYPHFDGRLFNLYERGARRLLDAVAPDRYCPVRGPADPSPHLLIVGLSAMGQQVALQAARLGHYANGRKLRLTAVGSDGGARDRYLRWLYPALSEVVEWDYLDAADYGASPERLEGWRRNPTLAAIYVCLDDDAQGLTIARRYHQHLKAGRAAVVVCLSQRTRLAELLVGRFDADEPGPAPLKPAQFASLGDEGANRSPSPIQVFDLIGRVCRTRQVLDEELDLLARALHDNYREPLLQALEEREKQPLKLRDWDELSEDLRDSNRYQADFLPVKLRLLGYRLRRRASPPAAAGDFTVPENRVDILARMEHNRWLAERRLAGWTWGDRRDDAAKLHPDLVPYDQLSPEKQENNNRAPQRQLPALLEQVLPKLGWSLERL